MQVGDKMIKCEVIKEFTLKRFNELKNIKRKNFDIKGKLYVGDTFECDEDMVKYLTGNNDKGEVVVKVIEVEPEMPTIIGHRTDDVEYVIPLNTKEVLEKLGEEIKKYVVIEPKKNKKAKSSKK